MLSVHRPWANLQGAEAFLTRPGVQMGSMCCSGSPRWLGSWSGCTLHPLLS